MQEFAVSGLERQRLIEADSKIYAGRTRGAGFGQWDVATDARVEDLELNARWPGFAHRAGYQPACDEELSETDASR